MAQQEFTAEELVAVYGPYGVDTINKRITLMYDFNSIDQLGDVNEFLQKVEDLAWKYNLKGVSADE